MEEQQVPFVNTSEKTNSEIRQASTTCFNQTTPIYYNSGYWHWHCERTASLSHFSQCLSVQADCEPADGDFRGQVSGQNSRHFADDMFRCILENEKFCIFITISLTFVPKGPINNIPALVQTMALRWIGDKPLSEPLVPHFSDALTAFD